MRKVSICEECEVEHLNSESEDRWNVADAVGVRGGQVWPDWIDIVGVVATKRHRGSVPHAVRSSPIPRYFRRPTGSV